MKKPISQQLMTYLEDRGVEHVFGMCGHTNIAVLAAMEKSSIQFVNVRHEQIAAHMADGYARARNQTAVVLTHMRSHCPSGGESTDKGARTVRGNEMSGFQRSF